MISADEMRKRQCKVESKQEADAEEFASEWLDSRADEIAELLEEHSGRDGYIWNFVTCKIDKELPRYAVYYINKIMKKLYGYTFTTNSITEQDENDKTVSVNYYTITWDKE